MTAKLLLNNTVHLKWRFSSRGWRAKQRLIRIEQSDGVTVYEKETSLDENEILIDKLAEQKTYSLVFCPLGENLNSEIGSVRFALSVLEINMEGAKGAFVSDVGLETSVDWNGAIRKGYLVLFHTSSLQIKFNSSVLSSYVLIILFSLPFFSFSIPVPISMCFFLSYSFLVFQYLFLRM